MGTAFVEEYAAIAKDIDGQSVQIPGRLLAIQSVTTSGTSARTSSDFNAQTRFIVISSNANEHFLLGSSTVTATTAGRPLYANSHRALEVRPVDDNSQLDYQANPTRIAFINQA